MKSLYPRPSYIPKDFVFVGQGKDFKHKVGEDYYYVPPRDEFNDAKRCHKAQMKGCDIWRDDCDFYVSPTRFLKPNPKKYKICGSVKYGFSYGWEVYSADTFICACNTRKMARDIVKALKK